MRTSEANSQVIILPAPSAVGMVIHVPSSDRPVTVNGWTIQPGELAKFCVVCDEHGYKRWGRELPQPPDSIDPDLE